MKSLAVFLALVSLAAPLRAADGEALALPQPVIAAPTSVPAALYSFADVYRLTTGRTPIGLPQPQGAAEAAIRVAVVEAAGADEPRFSVRQLPGASSWLLALAGLALAGWVAHRRLSYL
jgi:hypothetical protein